MKPSRSGFGCTLRQLMISVAVVAGLFVFIDSNTHSLWIGRTTIPLRFTVLDADTNQPISGSKVRLDDDGYYESPKYWETTGLDGMTKITIRTGCTGSGGVLRGSRNVTYWPWTIFAESDGYQTFEGRLEKHTGDRRFHDYNAAPPPIVIRLHNSPYLPVSK